MNKGTPCTILFCVDNSSKGKMVLPSQLTNSSVDTLDRHKHTGGVKPKQTFLKFISQNPMPMHLSLIHLALIIIGAATAEENLRMREGAAFKIALFADLHFGEDAWTEWGPRQDFNSLGVMSAVLDNEHPGLEFIVYVFFFIVS